MSQSEKTLERGQKNASLRQYSFAVLSAAVALSLRQLLTPLLGQNNPYHTLWAAVVFSAWYCGLGPSVLTTVLGVLGVWYWFLPTHRSFALDDPRTAISGMIGFLFFSGLIIALGETNRRSVLKSKRAEDLLKKAHDDLEKQVEQRTADLNLANESLRELSGRLQQMQDEERRRIARELHDSVGQLLASISMNLSILQQQAGKLDASGVRALADNASMVDQITREIRTISHLLHPPLLDAAGLASALRWYVDGFAERSKINVEVDIPEEFGRLSDEMEIAIFRMVQECLTNIHKHSSSTSAIIRVREEDNGVFVEVQDQGKGIPLDKQLELSSPGRTGVGFRGMRERLRQLGGTFDVRSDQGGTLVTAALPAPKLNSGK